MSIKPINFRPATIEDLIINKVLDEMTEQKGKKITKSDVVRFLIREAGTSLFTEKEYQTLVLYAADLEKGLV